MAADLMRQTIDPVISDYMRRNGRLGAGVRQLNQEERDLGVRVRLKKAELIRQGYSEQEALRRARVLVKGTP